MKKFIQILLIALVATLAFGEILEEENVQVMTDDNASEIIAQEFVLVEFYAPWCGHCKKLAPEYSKAAAQLKSSDKPVPLAKCDATVHKKASAPYDVKGFPTLKFFNNGQPMEYNGGRTASDIVNWVSKRTGDVSKLIQNQSELDQLKSGNKLALVFFTESVEGQNWESFKQVAMKYDNIAFGHSTDASLAQANDAKLNQLVLFKQFDEGRNDFTGEFNAEAITQFVDGNKLATVMEFDDSAIEAIFQKQMPTLFLFQNDNEESSKARQIFDAAAKELKGTGEVIFSYLTPSSQHWQRLADYIGVNTAKVPALQLVKAGKTMEKFKYEAEISLENIKEFIGNWKNKLLKPFIKSEEIPATNDEPVKVVVGKNFDEIVMNNQKDVLLELYAPWCGHCKKLAPEWDAAAERLQANPNIVIAKCDATANEIPDIQIQGYPTLKFFPNGSKNSPIEFNGDRNADGIIAFLKEKTTHPWVDLDNQQQQTQQQQTNDETKRDDL
ncbi:Thioredoxin-like fold [Pseudocohnilembus persalinus]|uniref:Protein disulfide-isomerase n=1 Tax=Pseudocohnilembus persalinus TaxID=266149 RepID=A0A0V0QD04_PSEPJ|nr:Thioredoxin-like fold [Pseudocohnilembus persalinus]|eukprot:KRX00097.1 Thioredoxin-like fold [Pseudocohnilembus persalinus]